MGAIMREGDGILFILVFGDLHYFYSQPQPHLLCSEICYPNPSIDSLFPGHDNTTYDERAAAGTHLTVLRWIRRSDFVVFRSNITKLGPNMDGVCMNG